MDLTKQEKITLLTVARDSIRNALEEKEPVIDKATYTVTPALQTNVGAFVTLEKSHRLRGCVGYIEGNGSLFNTVSDAAVAAALSDSRFPRVTKTELSTIEIEISVLSPLRRIKNVDDVEVGRHGLLIRSGYNHGLLLPQVATEHGWDRDTFLEQTCVKAGLPRNAFKWKETQLDCFTAIVFGESDFEWKT